MIVNASINHLNQIMYIENSSFQMPWSTKQIENDIKSKSKTENWVYIKKGKVLGYIFGDIILDEYHINNIATHPDFLRIGIGTKLITHIILKLRLQDIKIVLLEVSVSNIVAQYYYDSLGFFPVGNRKDYYGKGNDAILYNLDINKYG